jgi:hypothetical protein
MTASSTPTHLPFLYSFWSFLVSFSTIFFKNCPLFHIKNAQIICLKNHLNHLIAGTWSISTKLCRLNRSTIAFLPANNHMQIFEFASFYHSTPSPTSAASPPRSSVLRPLPPNLPTFKPANASPIRIRFVFSFESSVFHPWSPVSFQPSTLPPVLRPPSPVFFQPSTSQSSNVPTPHLVQLLHVEAGLLLTRLSYSRNYRWHPNRQIIQA